MERDRGTLDVHVRALEGFPDDEGDGVGSFDRSYAIVEVILRWIPSATDVTDARFHCVRRSLADFVHLETLESESSEHATRPLGILSCIERYEAALHRPRFGSIASETERLTILLEMALTMVLESESSATTKLFFGRAPTRSDEAQRVLERCFVESEGIEEEALVGGGHFSHEVSVDKGSIVVWKFAFAGDAFDFSAAFSAASAHDAEEVDPYSEAAWSASAPKDKDGKIVLQYSTRYSEDEDTWIYGAARVPDDATGVVTLEWIDVGEPSIVSKSLRFQASVVDASHADWAALTSVVTADAGRDEGDWLEAIVSSSPVTKWPTATSEHLDVIETDHDDSIQAIMTPTEATRHSEIQMRELQNKVFKLEEELQATRQELKTTKSELEISSEIYKANLETIAQLEVAPRTSHRHAAPLQSEATIGRDSIAGEKEEDADSYGDADDAFQSEEDEGEEEEAADSETKRLRGLVATFQEQCLWRSIETSESEKRNLLLEAELHQLDQDKQALVDKLAARDHDVATLVAENQRLKAQKTVLVKEVKRLQPYSQVNLSALIREAEEARMMQRSLQAQLQAFVAANSPETDHPAALEASE